MLHAHDAFDFCFLETELHHAGQGGLYLRSSTNLSAELTGLYKNNNFLQSEHTAVFVIGLFGFVVLCQKCRGWKPGLYTW